MPTPRPGRPTRSSDSGRPIMALLDLLGRRWTLRMLWELHDGPLGFAALQERCDAVSPSVLSQRLRELRETQLVEATPDGRYRIGPAAADLGEILLALDAWSKRWARRLGSSRTGARR